MRWLAGLLLISLLIFGPMLAYDQRAMAAVSTSLTFSFPSDVQAGEVFSVETKITAPTSELIGQVRSVFHYDSVNLEFIGEGDKASVFSSQISPLTVNTTAGIITQTRGRNVTISGEQALGELLFRSKNPGSAQIGFADGTEIIKNGRSLNFSPVFDVVKINPSTADAPIIALFSVQPSSVLKDTEVSLRWNIKNADTVSISPDIGAVNSSGEKKVVPQATTKYSLTAQNSRGSISADVTAIITQPPASVSPAPIGLPVVKSFKSAQLSLKLGQATKLDYDVENADVIEIVPHVGQVSATGASDIRPGQTTTYTLTASNYSAHVSREITIGVSGVTPAFQPPAASATASPKAKTVSSLAPSANPTPTTGVVSVEKSNVFFSATTIKNDDVDAIAVFVTLRNAQGEVITDRKPAIEGLSSSDHMSEFTFDTISQTWVARITSAVSGTPTIRITADGQLLKEQSLTIGVPPSAAPLPLPTNDDGAASFGRLLTVGIISILGLIIALGVLWRKLRIEEAKDVISSETESHRPDYQSDGVTQTPHQDMSQSNAANPPPSSTDTKGSSDSSDES